MPETIDEAENPSPLKKKVGTAAAIALLAVLVGVSAGTSTAKAAEQPTPPQNQWSFAGAFGTYDRAQLQRGFQVYREVCAACHGLTLVAYRNLAEPGGPGFTKEQAAAIAAEAQIKDGPNDQGEMFERPGRLADRFPSPYPNPQAAAVAFNGVAPPDLSVMAKARTYHRGFPTFLFDILTQYQEAGPDYIVAYLTGYTDPPADFKLPDGANYNKYYAGHATAMPPPLADGLVAYTDDTPQTAKQYAKDVAAFLMWTAEPHLEARKRLGFQVMVFLLILTGLLYFTKKRVWDPVHQHHDTHETKKA
nr:cytochrome c1 [Rhodovulum sp. PH10]